MINLAELFSAIRFSLRDTGKQRVSDVELVYAFNAFNTMVMSRISREKLPLMVQYETIYMYDGEGTLPSDYMGVYKVRDGNNREVTKARYEDPSRLSNEYFIEGEFIYSDRDELKIAYYPVPKRIDLSDTYYDMNPLFFDMYLDGVRSMLSGNTKGVSAIMFRLRDYTNALTFGDIPNDYPLGGGYPVD